MKEKTTKHQNYELVLPEGYQEDKVIDAKHITTAIVLNLFALVLFFVVLGIGVLILLVTRFSNQRLEIEVTFADMNSFMVCVINS